MIIVDTKIWLDNCTIACFKVSSPLLLTHFGAVRINYSFVSRVLITTALILLCRKRVWPDGSKLLSAHPVVHHAIRHIHLQYTAQYFRPPHLLLRSRWCAESGPAAFIFLIGQISSIAARRPTWPLQLSNMPGDMKRPWKALFLTYFPPRPKLNIYL